MLKAAKRSFRCALRTLGFDAHRLPLPKLTVRDLEFDLGVLLAGEATTVFDVGANKGQSIELFIAARPDVKIVAFEPNPVLAASLATRFAQHGVVVEASAVGEADGSIQFNVAERDELSSVLSLDRQSEGPFSRDRITRTIQVPLISLDTYIAERPAITRVELLKVDTQGYDLAVLRGCFRSLRGRVFKYILVEVNFISIYAGQCSFGEVERFLRSVGYGLVGFYEVVRNGGRCVDWATAIFARASSKAPDDPTEARNKRESRMNIQ